MAYGTCKVCGCTDDHACMTDYGSCWWVDEGHTLCSACAMERGYSYEECMESQRLTPTEYERLERIFGN